MAPASAAGPGTDRYGSKPMVASFNALQLRRLFEATVAIGSGLELQLVLERIVSAAADLVDATYGALGVLDEHRTRLSDFVSVGIDEATRADIGELPRGHGILGEVISNPKPLRLPDLSAHPSSQGFPPNHPPMTSFLGVPLLIRGLPFGNLYLCDKRGGGEFTESDTALLVALAAAAAATIDNARLFGRVSDLTLFEERERIARDLHDTVIQRLFAAGLSLQGLIRLVDDALVEERLEAVVDELDATVHDIRSAIFELHAPRQLGRSTRQTAVSLCAEAGRLLGFEPTIRFDGPIDAALSEEQSEHVLTVLREALSNVAKHARASGIDVRLSWSDGFVSLEVSDNGVGPDGPDGPVGPGRSDGGRGLTNMTSRAKTLGGDCTVSPGETGGTRVCWVIPTVDGTN